MIIDVVGMPAKYEHLRTRLRIEQSRCLQWGEKVGLVEELLDEPSKFLQLNHNLVVDILQQIQAAFRSCLAITSKYDPTVALQDQTSHQSIAARAGRSRFLQKTLAVWEKSGRLAGKIEWAMLRQDDFERLIVTLVTYNDRIESLLDRNSLQDLHTMQAQSQLVLLQMTDQVVEIRNLVQALQMFQPSRTDESASMSRSSTLIDGTDAEGQVLVSLAVFKAHHLKIQMTENLVSGLLLPFEKLEIDGSQPHSGRQAARLESRHIWLEWRGDSADVPLPLDHIDTFEKRVKKLSAILAAPDKPAAFRSPQCLGYVRSDERHRPRFALVLERPRSTRNDSAELVSLRERIQTSGPASLNARFELASMLAESLLYLHAVDWIHKGIRSESVLFQAGGGQRIKLYEPILSGIESSRPALPEELTVPNVLPLEHDLYRHPDLLKISPERSKKSDDVYSLGLVLAEIALWQPIEKIVGLELRRSKLNQVRSTMLDPELHIFGSIAERVGWIYADVVRGCITGGLSVGVPDGADEEDPRVGVEMTQALHKNVVLQLRSLKV